MFESYCLEKGEEGGFWVGSSEFEVLGLGLKANGIRAEGDMGFGVMGWGLWGGGYGLVLP
ncbi:hypothetical protein DMA11_22265 [Marinilabiliaceae bacterium JC017]|nr:hypothetical protein DMA11_22265 [Marinilabiliaceae bacterium JC017]